VIRKMKRVYGPQLHVLSEKSRPRKSTRNRLGKDRPKLQELRYRLDTMGLAVFVFLLIFSPFGPARAKEARLDKQSLEICAIPAVITDTGPGTAERNESPSTEEIQLETTGDNDDIFQVHVHDNFDNLSSFCDYESGLSNISVKRRLKKSVNFWLSIGTSDFIIEVIKDGYKIPLRSEPEQIFLKNNVSALQHEHFVDQAISDLVDSGSVVNIQEKPHVVNPLTVSVNAKGKERLILDLRHVNEHVVLSKMKFEDVAFAKQFLSSECFGFVWDLKLEYHHVDIFHSHCKYLGFEWKNNFYIFTVLPFGLGTSGYIFTKVVQSLVKYWHRDGIKAIVYLDDGFGLAPTKTDCACNAKRVKADLIAAGFVPNKDKCEWEPSQEMVWLGFHLNLKCGKLSVPKKKVKEILKFIQDLIQIKPGVKIRVLARFCGKIIALKPALGNVTQIMTKIVLQ